MTSIERARSASSGQSRGGPHGASCPRCASPLGAGTAGCAACGLTFRWSGGVIDVLGAAEREQRAALVETFYTASPFPGYAPSDDASTLLDRSRRSPFVRALDEAIPASGRVLSIGCGTAQVPAFLALSGPRRDVLGIDGCAASLGVADAFRSRVGIPNLGLVRADLFDLPVEPRSHVAVSCRGVVHHTPDPQRAIECVAECVAPGGVLVLGFYESMARTWHRTRQRIAGLRGGRPVRLLDPILRRADIDPEKKRIWTEDQYRHPLEHCLALPRVTAQLDALGFDVLRTVPPAPPADLFRPEGAHRPPSQRLRRLGWLLSGLTDPDAGHVAVVAQRRAPTAAPRGER